MNQTQRNYLIKKIEDRVKVQVEALKSNKPEQPNLNNFLLHAVLSNNFEIKSTEDIKEVLRKKALSAKSNEEWLSGNRNNWGYDEKVGFKIEDIFILPPEYLKQKNDFKEANDRINDEIRSISIQSDTLVTRIQLASDKTLDKMINEIDDMGDISLMDTKIRLLNS